jgi:hypothetical protein
MNEITYGQLDKVLRMLGFTVRSISLDGNALVYDHKGTGATIILPPFPETDKVLPHHLIIVRSTLDNFGIADPTAFAEEVQKTG